MQSSKIPTVQCSTLMTLCFDWMLICRQVKGKAVKQSIADGDVLLGETPGQTQDTLISQVNWKWLGISPDKLEEVTGEKQVWAFGRMDGWMAKVVLWVVKIDFNLFHLAGIEKVFSILIRTMGICKSSTWFSSDTEMVNIIIFLTVTNDWKMFAMTFRQALKRVAVVLLLENKSNHKRFTSKSKKKRSTE